MSGIDDPIEAAKQHHPEKSPGPIAVMLDVLGPCIRSLASLLFFANLVLKQKRMLGLDLCLRLLNGMFVITMPSLKS